jgi:hypothetical protein
MDFLPGTFPSKEHRWERQSGEELAMSTAVGCCRNERSIGTTATEDKVVTNMLRITEIIKIPHHETSHRSALSALNPWQNPRSMGQLRVKSDIITARDSPTCSPWKLLENPTFRKGSENRSHFDHWGRKPSAPTSFLLLQLSCVVRLAFDIDILHVSS